MVKNPLGKNKLKKKWLIIGGAILLLLILIIAISGMLKKAAQSGLPAGVPRRGAASG
mgnify:CR=1 FL=1